MNLVWNTESVQGSPGGYYYRPLLLLFNRSVTSDSFAIRWTVANQAPLSMGLSRQEYWSGLQFFSPGDLPSPGIEPPPPELAG